MSGFFATESSSELGFMETYTSTFISISRASFAENRGLISLTFTVAENWSYSVCQAFSRHEMTDDQYHSPVSAAAAAVIITVFHVVLGLPFATEHGPLHEESRYVYARSDYATSTWAKIL